MVEDDITANEIRSVPRLEFRERCGRSRHLGERITSAANDSRLKVDMEAARVSELPQ